MVFFSKRNCIVNFKNKQMKKETKNALGYLAANSRFFLWMLSVLFITGVSSCKKDKDKPLVKEVQLENTGTFGNILSDKDGRTLYFFANDAISQNTCTGGCAAIWPVFYIKDLTQDKLGDGLKLEDFRTIITSSGKEQLSYKGWPLYYYAPLSGGTNVQEAPGQTSGEGVNGVWFIAKPDYTIMFANHQLTGHDGKNYLSNYTEGTGKTLYFTDGAGLTLYTFKKDSANNNNFTASDFSNNGVWPIYETDKIVVPSVLDKTLFGSISVFGKKQLTYKKWPLYHFGQDANIRGNNKGVSFPAVGVWPVPVKDMPNAPQ